MKQFNIAKTLGIVGICIFIFGTISCIATEFDDWAGIMLGISIPLIFLYPLSAKAENRLKDETTVACRQKEKMYLFLSPDPTLDNK